MRHILEIDSVRLLFGDRLILSDIYLKIETGQVVGLLGRNGEGKSSLMRVAFGTLPAEKSVRCDGKTIFEAYKQPHLLGYVPQHNFIPKSMTLRRIFRERDIDFAAFGKDFPEVQLDDDTVRLKDLSGGTVRLIELYTLIRSACRFVFLDEPFTHISPVQILKIKAIIGEERSRKGFLITDHLYKHVADLSDTIYILKNGKNHLVSTLYDMKESGYIG
ncbi:MAG TPA: ABC transporter ATP-binding protein [Porphyromonadaceae bacterium]|nr:ABC transporter ATP-binding protein [Porphyromonadaceae bacterium]